MEPLNEERVITCKECEETFEVNRIGQAFCSKQCRNRYNNRLLKLSKRNTEKIDKVLHQNRLLLSERVGLELSIKELQAIGFNFYYFTSLYREKNINHHLCYEYGYYFTPEKMVKIFQTT